MRLVKIPANTPSYDRITKKKYRSMWKSLKSWSKTTCQWNREKKMKMGDFKLKVDPKPHVNEKTWKKKPKEMWVLVVRSTIYSSRHHLHSPSWGCVSDRWCHHRRDFLQFRKPPGSSSCLCSYMGQRRLKLPLVVTSTIVVGRSSAIAVGLLGLRFDPQLLGVG